MRFFYKTTDQRVLDACSRHLEEKQQMNTEMKAFAAHFDAEAVLVRDINGIKFDGLKLKNFYERSDADLWTKPSRDFSVSRPRATCKGKTAALKALQEKYKSLMPICKEASFEPMFNALGFDWTSLFFGSISFFYLDGTFYLSASFAINDATEILGSEFDDAKKTFESKKEVSA